MSICHPLNECCDFQVESLDEGVMILFSLLK